MTSNLSQQTAAFIPYNRDCSDDFFYPDPDPKPDSMEQGLTIHECAYLLHDYFAVRPDVLVDASGSIYYDRQDRRRSHVAPDLYITFGVDAATVFERNNYLIWEAGKSPDFALEVASRSTHRVDTRDKPALYAAIGVGEYWRFDPSGGSYYGYDLAGDILVDGVYQPLPVSETPDGMIQGYSPALDLILCVRDRRLFFHDPKTGRAIASISEQRAETEQERAAREAAEAEAERLRAELRRLKGQ
jgi:hypothetical protein